MRRLTTILCLALIAAFLICLTGCTPAPTPSLPTEPTVLTNPTQPSTNGWVNIDWQLHGVWITPDGAVQSGQEGVDFSLRGNLPAEFEPYSTVEMELNFVWPDGFVYPNEGPQTYTGGANPADKHENQPIYHGGKYVYSPEENAPIFLSYSVCPEEGFVVFHIGDQYLVASTDPKADPVQIFNFYKEYVKVA